MASTTTSNEIDLVCAIPTTTLGNINGVAHADFDIQRNSTERGGERETERERGKTGAI